MKRIIHICLLLALVLFTACDDGHVDESYEALTGGRSAHLTATVTGFQSWPSGYKLALATFAEGDSYAAQLISLHPDETGQVDAVLTDINETASSLELCVVNILHQRVATFARMSKSEMGSANSFDFDAGSYDVSMFNTIQTNLFDLRCTACHGQTGSAARGLFLTAGKSHAALVGVESGRLPGKLLVAPGSPRNSVLYEVLSTDVSADWGQPHTDMLSPEKDAHLITLLHDWIKNMTD